MADRIDKRRLMVVLQSLMGVQALVLALLTLTGHVTYYDVCILALLLGFNNCFENPSRQAFVLEMVGPTSCETRSASTRRWSMRRGRSGRPSRAS